MSTKVYARRQQGEEAIDTICTTGTKRESHQTCISVPECEAKSRVSQAEAETHIQQTHVSAPRHKVHVLLPRRETPCPACCCAKTRVQLRLALAREVCVQPPKAQKNVELESPHPMGSRLVLQISYNGSKGLLDKEEECPSNHCPMLL